VPPRHTPKHLNAIIILIAICAGTASFLEAQAPPVAPMIHVTWQDGLGPAERTALERRYHLENLGPKESTTWVYTLRDTSTENIRALIQSPDVRDTHFLDRTQFTVSPDAAPYVPPWVSPAVADAGNVASTEKPELSEEHKANDPEKLMTLRTAQDVAALRQRLVTFLWGDGGLPRTLPAAVIDGVEDRRFTDIHNLARIDVLSIDLEFGLSTFVYHFVPRRANGEVVLYHEGHGDDFSKSKLQIAPFIESGYAVLAFNMPLAGRADHPIADTQFGKIKLDTHEQFKLLLPPSGHATKYFVEPVVIALNYLERQSGVRRVSMVGISGGGWTTTLAAAVDVRISRSFPVAGSYPLYLRSSSPRDWGDWEQTTPELYRVAGYLDLYLLGAAGEGREQLQILNAYDPCCFAGDGWQTYRRAVHARVLMLGTGGAFDVWSDATHHEHAISDAALQHILAALRDEP
jgi:hypothetical protein